MRSTLSLAPLWFLLSTYLSKTTAFTLPIQSRREKRDFHSISTLSLQLAAGQGFGRSSNDGLQQNRVPEKTYGDSQRPIRDMIDVEAAMKEFFSSREEWTPLFRSMMTMADRKDKTNSRATSSSCPAWSFIGRETESQESELDFEDATKPWKRLQATPTAEDDRQVMSRFLDSIHQSLLDIPVSESEGVDYDENDMHFLEEGRRLLAISRFHVVRQQQNENSFSLLQSYDELFTTCWSELYSLRSQAQEHTGSLILLPNYSNNNDTTLADLRRFTDINLLRPLEWLGLSNDFEIATIYHRHAGTKNDVDAPPAIRLLYKLSDMPSDNASEEQD